GILVEEIEQNKIQQADYARSSKAPAPAKMQQNNPEKRHAHSRRKFRGAIKHRRGQAALLRREPVADGLRIARERRRFADPQQESRTKKPGKSRRYRGCKRSHAPEKRADTPDQLHAKAIQNQSGGKLQRCVRPVIRARKIAEGNGGNSKRV